MHTDARKSTIRPPSGQPWRPGFLAGAFGGLAVMGTTIAVAELLASAGIWFGWWHTASSVSGSLGGAFIELTPEWLKEFAIRTFGQHDKDALRAGMWLTLALVGVGLGLVARWRWWPAAVIAVAAAVLAGVAILTRAGAGVLDLIPLLVGAAGGLWVLSRLYRGGDRARPAVTTGGQAIASAEPEGDFAGTATDPVRQGTQHRASITRRGFLGLAAIASCVAVAAGTVPRLIPAFGDVIASRVRFRVPVTTDRQHLPSGTDLKVDGLSPFVTPNALFYRVDTAFTLPQLSAEDWQLRIHGMVDREITLDIQELLARPQIERVITLTCVSNEVGGDLVGNAVWIGTRIDALLAEAGVRPGADAVLCTSVDGFTSSTPLEALTDGRDAILAVAMNGEPLPIEHGFPVRMIVPGLYGYVSATKWVVDLQVTTFADVTAYWTARGWSDRGPIKMSSRFDVPKGFAQYRQGESVVFAGMAWAQQHGISAVEVQVDDGPWQRAALSASLSKDTWRQWRFGWTAVNGLHTVRCRAIDGSGRLQDAQVRPILPDGSTGYDSRNITVA